MIMVINVHFYWPRLTLLIFFLFTLVSVLSFDRRRRRCSFVVAFVVTHNYIAFTCVWIKTGISKKRPPVKMLHICPLVCAFWRKSKTIKNTKQQSNIDRLPIVEERTFAIAL